ncbi:MAG: hypothetical protein WCJ70_00625 [bacterium]
MRYQSKYTAKLSKTIHEHKLVLFYTLFLWLAGFVANHFIDPHQAFFSGEHIFSFDYLGHIKNILAEFYSNPQLLLQTNICENCPYIYHYSRWHALINFIVLAGGQLLKMNPMVYEVFFSLTVVAINTNFATYCLNAGKVKVLPYLLSNAIYSSLILSFIYLGGGHYAIHASSFLLSVSYFIKCANELETCKTSGLIVRGIISGLLGFFFLNISLGFLPIYIYSLVVLGIFAVFRKPWDWLRIVIIMASSFFTTALVNSPISLSLILHGNTHKYDNFISLTTTKSFFFALTGTNDIFTANSGDTGYIILAMSLIVLWMAFYYRSRRAAISCLAIYFACSLLMQGNIIYGLAFNHAPFMGTLRSVHRLTVIQHATIFICIYYGLDVLGSKMLPALKLCLLFFTILLIPFSFKYASDNIRSAEIARVPVEYFQLNEKLDKLLGKKVYFPAYLPPHELVQGNYKWFKEETRMILLYTNIFSSLFAPSGMQLLERHESGMKQMELRSLLDLRNSYSDLQQSLVTQNIQYLILDKNFAWDKNFPDFDVDEFVKPYKLLSVFGNLYLYETKANQSTCPTAYGLFTSKYCHITRNDVIPQYLVNISNSDYLLQRHKPLTNEKLERVKGAKYYEGIPNPELQNQMLLHNIPYFGFFTLDNEENEKSLIYRKRLEKGDYVLVINSIKMVLSQELPTTQNIEIMVNANNTAQVSPYSNRPGIYSTKIPIHVTDEGWVKLYISAKGSSNMSEPYLIEKSEYEKLLRNQVSKIPEVGL